jgi:hypothetical protein
MLLSTLHRQIRAECEDPEQYTPYLAQPDTVVGDSVEAFVIGIADVEVDDEQQRIRLIPASMADGTSSILLLSVLLSQLPSGLLQSDYEILIELPLDRETPGYTKSTTPVAAFHVGADSGEAWFLVRPASEYAAGALPE